MFHLRLRHVAQLDERLLQLEHLRAFRAALEVRLRHAHATGGGGVVGVVGGGFVGVVGSFVGSVGGLPVALPLSFTQYSGFALPKPSLMCLLLKFFPPACADAGPCAVTSPGAPPPRGRCRPGSSTARRRGGPRWPSSLPPASPSASPSPRRAGASSPRWSWRSSPGPCPGPRRCPCRPTGGESPRPHGARHVRQMLQKVSRVPSPLESRGV